MKRDSPQFINNLTYAGTVDAYSRSAAGVSSAANVTVSPCSLFIADYAVTHSHDCNDKANGGAATGAAPPLQRADDPVDFARRNNADIH